MLSLFWGDEKGSPADSLTDWHNYQQIKFESN